MPILPQAIYIFNAIQIKLLTEFLTQVGKSILKCQWNYTSFQIAPPPPNILKKKNKGRGVTLPYQTIP